MKLKELKNKIYFIDLENVHTFSMDKINKQKSKVIILAGDRQHQLPIKFMKNLSSVDFEFIQVKTSGRNVLDFHLTYLLGDYNHKFNNLVEFVVVSQDKGFDKTIDFIKEHSKRHIKRINNI